MSDAMIKARIYAQSIAEAMQAAYWVETDTTKEMHVRNAIEFFDKLAAQIDRLMGDDDDQN